MTTDEFNQVSIEERTQILFSCCGSKKWSGRVADGGPYLSFAALVKYAETVWYNECEAAGWKEAFLQHPRIGDKKSLHEKFAAQEQGSVATAPDALIDALAAANSEYEKKNGFIFIVCATGKSAQEMLDLIKFRLDNDSENELRIAMGEQHKISIIRLRNLFADMTETLPVSQLTTHVLETSEGKPAQGMKITLLDPFGKIIACGITNADGRVSDLLAPYRTLMNTDYTLLFETNEYYNSKDLKTFYPQCRINFTISDDSHYHVPLLISPYGYSTYRGS